MQQRLPFTVCAAECEAAEEQSDDEAHTLQVPERSEGKTKEIRKELTVYGIETINHLQKQNCLLKNVATVLTVYGIETYQLLCLLAMLLVATALTVYGIETL